MKQKENLSQHVRDLLDVFQVSQALTRDVNYEVIDDGKELELMNTSNGFSSTYIKIDYSRKNDIRLFLSEYYDGKMTPPKKYGYAELYSTLDGYNRMYKLKTEERLIEVLTKYIVRQ